MANITIFGTGNMGTAIGTVFAAGGLSVQHIDSDTSDQTVSGDIVVLAVPYAAIASIAADRADQLAGKIIVDISNPVNFETFDGLTVATDGSAAAELAAALPQSQVLKAFNTNFAATLATGKVGDDITTVLVAGDDAEAKAAFTAAATTGMTVKVIDAGSLKRARELEAMGFLQITLAAGEKISWTSGFAVIA